MLRSALAILLLMAAPAAFAQDIGDEGWLPPPGTYTLDPQSVYVSMTARRFLMSPINAEFGSVSGAVTVGPDAISEVQVSIAAADLAANGPIVERMLKGEDFLNTEVHPRITFTAQGFAVSDDPAALAGLLIMAGITHPADFHSQLLSREIDPETGALRLRFDVEGDLMRADWGMTGYRGLVSDSVRIRIDATFIQQTEEPRLAD